MLKKTMEGIPMRMFHSRFAPLYTVLLTVLLLLASCMRLPGDMSGRPGVSPDAQAPAVPSPAPDAPSEESDAHADVFRNNAQADSAVLSALYAYYRNVWYDDAAEFDRIAAEGKRKITVYACRAYREGMLVAAKPWLDGELTADLFRATRGSCVWDINYTRLFGDTIVYGASFAWDNGTCATTRAEADFLDGQTDTVEMVCAEKDDDGRMGFLLIAQGETWLSSLRLFNGDQLVADDTDPNFSGITSDVRYDETLSLFDRTRFLPAHAVAGDAHGAALQGGGMLRAESGTCGLSCIALADGVTPADLWRSNIVRFDALHVTAGAALTLELLGDAVSVCAYLADLSLEDGTEAGQAACLGAPLSEDAFAASEGGFSLRAPDAPGFYVLILQTADAYLFAGIRVE